VSGELALFVQFFLMGAMVALSYDFLRVIRRIIAHGLLWISLEDIIFSLLAGGGLFLVLCDKNDGILRGYILLAALLGVIVGALCVGRYILRFSEKLIFFVKNGLKKLSKAATIMRKKIRRERLDGKRKETAP
jgi:spore cortex biosynthesis protein YabQ